MPRWAWCLVGALLCYLLAVYAAPQLPVGGAVIGTILWIGAILLTVIGVILLILWFVGRGPRSAV